MHHSAKFAKFHADRSSLEKVNMHHNAKLRADKSNHCGDMAIFLFFKMAADRLLVLLKVRNFNCWYSL